MPNEWKLCTHSRLATSSPSSFLEPLHQLRRGLDVVGQDEDVLRLERRIRREQVADALDDDRRLAGARAGKHHQRPVAPLDRGSLFFCQLKRAFGDCTLRYRYCHPRQG